MIKNIIFDYGDVFINLDKIASHNRALELFKVDQLSPKMIDTNLKYEMGLISTNEFISFYKNNFSFTTEKEIIDAWNIILKDFPLHRLTFIKNINAKYRCFLLSNTNELHIDWIINDWGKPLYNEFKDCFEQFYLSHEMNMRKPNLNIYEYVLEQNNLIAEETLFIDDTQENTKAAANLGVHVWNINPEKEDVVNLFKTHSSLF